MNQDQISTAWPIATEWQQNGGGRQTPPPPGSENNPSLLPENKSLELRIWQRGGAGGWHGRPGKQESKRGRERERGEEGGLTGTIAGRC